MPRYAAFLRGVTPMNAKMPQVRTAFESAGFTDVKTLVSSGNVVFAVRASSETALQKRIEAVLEQRLRNAFLTIVRPVDALRRLHAAPPGAGLHDAAREGVRQGADDAHVGDRDEGGALTGARSPFLTGMPRPLLQRLQLGAAEPRVGV
jgi:uncharacterized protein (DUF1697 family)